MQEKQIFAGNILIVVCCGFYLAWWLLAFRPTGANVDMKTGWLLLPAFITGLAGVILTLRGINAEMPNEAPARQLIPGGFILWGGLAALIILLIVTALLLKRPVTTELFLIVGWCMLALSEINALFRSGLFSQGLSVGFLVLIFAAAAISMVCYILYYNLNNAAGFVTGMIPLIISAIVIAIISIFIAISNYK